MHSEKKHERCQKEHTQRQRPPHASPIESALPHQEPVSQLKLLASGIISKVNDLDITLFPRPVCFLCSGLFKGIS